MSGASVRPPSSGWFFGPSSVRFFCFLALSGFARFGPGVLVLVFSLFPFAFCVPPLVFWLSSCHLIFIVISFSSFLHLIRRGLKKPRGSGACVWNIWRDVKLYLDWRNCFFVSGSLPLQWTSCEYFTRRLSNLLFNCRGRDGWFPSHANEAMEINWMEVWTQTSVPAVSLLGAFKSQLGDTSYLTALSSANQTSTWGFSLLIIQWLLSGLIGVFMHVRCIPLQNSQRCFWASKCEPSEEM